MSLTSYPEHHKSIIHLPEICNTIFKIIISSSIIIIFYYNCIRIKSNTVHETSKLNIMKSNV